MKNRPILWLTVATLLFPIFALRAAPLINLINPAPGQSIQPTHAKTTPIDQTTLRLDTLAHPDWPGLTIATEDKPLDLSAAQSVQIDLRNLGPAPLRVYLRIDDPQGDGSSHSLTESITLAGSQWQTLTVPLYNSGMTFTKPITLNGMRGYPSMQGKIDLTRIVRFILFLSHPDQPQSLEVRNLRATGKMQILDPATFLPFIDPYGQYSHGDWPGKLHDPAEFKTRIESEQQDMTQHPGPANWNEYGGWLAGPQLQATGFFRVEKVQGKWWLIDPAGRLFWSHGVDCVTNWESTPISQRENYFAWLPPADGEFSSCFSQDNWAPHGFYQDKAPYKTFNIARANLIRKYGSNPDESFARIAHQRLRSWGLNTIGNWSDETLYLQRKTPYVASIGFSAPAIAGSSGYWGKFDDVFDPAFRANLKKTVRQAARQINDPWCIGFFVQNEQSWGSDTSLAEAALASPAAQPARVEFIRDLKTKYAAIDALNQTWGSGFADWNAFETNPAIPDQQKARPDLTAFYSKLADTYFRTIKEELKAAAPQQLYLGCRFADVNDLAARAAAAHCDIVSYNRYERSVALQKLPEGLDRPIIIGEFHFGALDRGLFHTGLVPTRDQNDRADHYRNYLRSALANPQIVGAHWFQYRDQATTGRGDGENYQIGLIDITDTPYPETINALRDIGQSLYQTRLQ